MKINSSKIISKIVSILAICVLLTSFSPSLDGRAVVVDEGVFPQGLFAKTVGYLPGDIISVTNIAGDANVDLLVIGALDPSEGVAIMLSPEAAAAIGIEKDSNSLVKITKRSNQDERVYGSAVISKPILQNVKEVEEVPTQIDMDNPVVDEPILEVEEEKIEEDSISEISIEEEIVEESVEDEIVEEEIVEEEIIEEEIIEEEIIEESVENEVVEDEIIENTDGSLQESLALEDVIFEEKEAEENIVEEKILEELVEDDILPREELVIEESLPEITEDFVEENTVDEESEEIIDENIIDSEAEEEIFVVDEPIADEFEEDIASTDNEIPAPYFELVEENELEPIDYLSERDASLEPKEEILEEIPAETEFLEEFVEVEDLDSLESINEEITTDDVEELPAEKEDEPIAVEETDEVILLEEEVEEELEAVEEYEAIVLVPAEENPPVVEETFVEESTEIKEEVSEVVEEKAPVESNIPETVAPVVEETIVTPIVEPAPAATSYEKYIVPSLKDLESGKYYIQIATLGDDANIMEIVNKYGNNYPITIVPKSSGSAKQVMIGPITIDEYGALLQRFKSYGFKDAFLRKIR